MKKTIAILVFMFSLLVGFVQSSEAAEVVCHNLSNGKAIVVNDDTLETISTEVALFAEKAKPGAVICIMDKEHGEIARVLGNWMKECLPDEFESIRLVGPSKVKKASKFHEMGYRGSAFVIRK